MKLTVKIGRKWHYFNLRGLKFGFLTGFGQKSYPEKAEEPE
jgi:hypothetical protein